MEILKKKGRTFEINNSNKKLKTPFFFPAISTVKTNENFIDYLKFLSKVGYPGFLISAYDIYHSKESLKIKEIINSTFQNTFIMIDSGYYEAFWKGDKNWSFDKMIEAIKDIEADFFFSYDVFWDDKKTIKKQISDIIANTAKTAGAQLRGETIPIVHANLKHIEVAIKGVIEGIMPRIISIPERELGKGILERAKNIKNIRREIDRIDKNILLHLLGTGNPASILIYSLCGADLFDALEWCKNAADPESAHLYHFIQLEFVKDQYAKSKLKGIPYAYKVMSHNLIFYEKFLQEIQKHMESGETDKLVKKYLPPYIVPKLKKII